MFNAGRFAKDLRLVLGAYVLVALIVLLLKPLWVSEVLILAATSQRTLSVLPSWFVGTPGAAPIFYYTQWLFVTIFGHPEVSGRVPSLLCGVISAWLLWRLARRVPVQQPFLALLLFMLIPVHFRLVTLGLPAEEALVFLLLASEQFFDLVELPTIKNAGLYAGLLLLCLYTEPYSFLPATGYLLFLLAFIKRAEQRRSLWFALPSTVIPALLFIPFYLWTHPQTAKAWLYGTERFPLSPNTALDVLRETTAGGVFGYILTPLLLIGLFVAGWRALSLPVNVILKRVKLFCLFGGVLSTILLVLLIDSTSNIPFWANHVLWITPALAILVTAALDWVAFTKRLGVVAKTLAVLLLILCIGGDVEYAFSAKQDLRPGARLVRDQLVGDSCVVFVSEGLSGYLFVVFEPILMRRECLNFFHPRIILASHPWVTSEQQLDAESYFRALNFAEVKHLTAQGTQVLVMEQR